MREDLNLGEVLRLLGRATPEQIAAAAQEQRSTGERIGEALVRMRVVTLDDVEQAVSLQHDLRGRGPASTKAAVSVQAHARERLEREIEALCFRIPPTDGVSE